MKKRWRELLAEARIAYIKFRYPGHKPYTIREYVEESMYDGSYGGYKDFLVYLDAVDNDYHQWYHEG
jgi:hypothetical protein